MRPHKTHTQVANNHPTQKPCGTLQKKPPAQERERQCQTANWSSEIICSEGSGLKLTNLEETFVLKNQGFVSFLKT